MNINIKPSEKTKRMLFYAPFIVKKELPKTLLLGNKDIGEFFTKKIKSNIKNNGGTGRLYNKYIRGRKISKRASGYGESPISWTGKLKSSNKYSINPKQVILYNNAPYSYFLENKKGGAPAGKRPFMLPVIKKYKQQVSRFYDKQMSKLINSINNARYW